MDIANYSLTELARSALQKPSDFGYWGDEEMFVTWGFTGHDKTAASKILEEANFKAISDDLLTRFPNDFRIERYKHWATGWVERLVCRILIHKDKEIVDENISEAFNEAMRYHEMLDDYPIIDETLYADMETLEIIQVMTDLPNYLLEMIDTEDPDWVQKMLESLYENLNVAICPDAESWPKDNEILMAIYSKELWNPENIEAWEDFCSENKLEFPPKKKNPNQLNLFGE